MSSFFDSIEGVGKSNHALGALFIALLAFIVADLIPTPGDAVTLKLQRDLRDEWKAGTISADEFWKRNIRAYLIPNLIWWFLVLLIVVNAPVSPRHKIYLALILIGAGASVAIVYNLYKKDKSQEARTKIQDK